MKKEISMVQFFKKMLSMLWLIILITVILAGSVGLCSKFFITPKYTSSAKMFVSNRTDMSSGTISSSDISARTSLAKTYAQIIKSNTLMGKICDKMNQYKALDGYAFLNEVKYTPEELSKLVRVAAINGTEVFTVSISTEDPQASQFIIQSITEYLPDIVDEKIKSSSVTLIDEATLPVTPSSPNILGNIIISALIGLVASSTVIFIIFVTDTVINTEEDLTKNFDDIAILGSIPIIDAELDRRSSTPINRG